MTNVFAAPTLDGLAERLQKSGFAALDAERFNAFAEAPGNALILFADDPVRGGETWDLAVILPEVLRALSAPLRAGFLQPDAGRRVQPRYGFSTWPAVLFLRDGEYVGVIEGLRDWETYQREMADMLAKPATRPPTLGVAVRGDVSGNACH